MHHDYPTLDEFLAACGKQSITKLIVAWRREWGPQQIATDPTDYGWRDECRVLAYADGTIHAHNCESVDRADLCQRLVAAGFSVEERSRNMVGWN
jgi:hypothetical protein